MATVAHAGSPRVEVETLDGAPDLAAVWASDDAVWVAGPKSELRVRRGASGTWTREKVPLLVDFTALAGTRSDDVWVGGIAGALGRWDGSSWTAASSGTESAYTSIAAVTPSLAAATSAKRLLIWNGDHWDSVLGRPAFEGLRAVAPVGAAGRFVAVGDGGQVVWVDGDRWEKVAAGVTEDLAAVGACGEGEIVAVGAAAVKRDAKGRWRKLAAPPTPVRAAVLRCDGARAVTVAAVSETELLLLDVKKNAWTRRSISDGAALTAIARRGEGLVVVGRRGLVATVGSW